MNSWEIWVGLPALVALALFTALNQSLRHPSRVRLMEFFASRGRGEESVDGFFAVRPDYFLATAVSRSASVITLFVSVFHFIYAVDASSDVASTIMGGVVAWVLLVIFGVAIPTAWSKYCGDGLIVHLLAFLAVLRLLCYPVLVTLQVFDPLVRHLAGVPVRDAKSHMHQMEKELLNAVSEGERHGAVDEEEKEMIESVIELSDTSAAEIMTPRTDIVALPKEADYDTVLETIRTTGHSRVPIYDETIDTILGILHAKDLLNPTDNGRFQAVRAMRPAFFIPETKPVRELLREFQKQGMHMAVVLDEYGGTAGLVTIEDILEELVGEITDEYEPTTPAEVQRIDDHTVEVDARMSIEDLNDLLPISLPDDQDFETIGGFVFSTLGKIPTVGERCEYNHVGIEVIAADPRRILRLRLRTPTEEHTEVET